jgi:hypothetical protein
MANDELARITDQLKKLDADIIERVARAEKLERVGLGMLGASGLVLLFSLYLLYDASGPQGDMTDFYYGLLVVIVLLAIAYYLIFNPTGNRKILKLQEERFTLRRRLENF